jgi:hypothetical protein
MSLLSEKRERVATLKAELERCRDGVSVPAAEMAKTALNNATADLEQFEQKLRDLKSQLDSLADL